MLPQWNQMQMSPNNKNNYNALFQLENPGHTRIRISDYYGKPVLHFTRQGYNNKEQYLQMRPCDFNDIIASKDKILDKIKDCSDFIEKFSAANRCNFKSDEDDEKKYEVIPKSEPEKEIEDRKRKRKTAPQIESKRSKVKSNKKDKERLGKKKLIHEEREEEEDEEVEEESDYDEEDDDEDNIGGKSEPSHS